MWQISPPLRQYIIQISQGGDENIFKAPTLAHPPPMGFSLIDTL